MNNNDKSAQYRDRVSLLKQMLAITEDMIGILKKESYNMGAVDELLMQRQSIITDLEALDAAVPTNMPGAFTKEELNEMNLLVRLVLGLSNDAAKLIETEKNQLLADMRVNCKEQKLVMYQTPKNIPEGVSASGKFFDYKK